MFELTSLSGGFALTFNGKTLLTHTEEAPALFLGRGVPRVNMFRGNFDIADRLDLRLPLHVCEVSGTRVVCGHPDLEGDFTLSFSEDAGVLRVSGRAADERYNRFWVRFSAEKEEHVTGGGEQFSYLDLRGRRYPIWTREQGVGRNKLTEITRLSDALDGSGGDYHTTFFPQPTFVSSKKYFIHFENYEYAVLDFTNEAFHEVEVWSLAPRFCVGTGESYPSLLQTLTGLLGRQPALPDWAMKGLWLGVQGGTQRALELRDRCVNAGADISAVWIQDWQGTRQTSFGKRNIWNWRWSEALYPGLDAVIREDAGRAWMGYINPYVVDTGDLYAEAKEKGYLVKRPDGTDYLFDFGEFDCGVVDLTLPAAFEWYKNVIKTNLIDLGLRGWMADFGEYLPVDAVCHGGSGWALHNRWPALWAQCNREAVEERGKLGECVFYMRAGAAGTQRYSTLMWAGDQNVDWSADDGLPSAITAALTMGMSGYGLSCSDIGGYTTLFTMRRDEELLKRWLEFACFTPVMRSHEGNRPTVNVQLYDTPELLAFTARITRLHDALLPYLRNAVRQNAGTGLPVMRPLFFAEDCAAAWETQRWAYLFGDDMLVAPVVEPGADTREVWMPQGDWVHLWTGKAYAGGFVTVPAPIGQPPVFYRAGAAFTDLFEELKRI
jgi:alpha-glucosidase